MADASLAALSDIQFVEECRNALNALYEAVVDAEAVARTKPYIPENYMAAFANACSLMPRVRDFASTRLNDLAGKYGISGVGNWMVEFHEDISDVKYVETKAQYVSFVLNRFNAINALRNIIRTDIGSGSGNLIDRLLAGPDDIVLDPRDMALLEAHLKQSVSLSTIQKERQQTGRSPTQEQRDKLRLIRDFNRSLPPKDYPPGQTPLDAATLLSMEEKLASVRPYARANTVVQGMAIDMVRSLGVSGTSTVIRNCPTPATSSTETIPEHSEGGINSTAVGFIGGEALANELGVHPSRRAAFFKQLERDRISLGDDNWQEVANRRANAPRYQYRVDSPRLREIAVGYRTPKRD